MDTMKAAMAVGRDMAHGWQHMLKPHGLTLVERIVEDEQGRVVSFRFKPDRPFEYKAGQYGVWLLNRFVWGKPGRLFSIASALGEDLMFTTHISDSDYKRKLDQLKPGDRMKFIGPVGQFVLPDPLPKTIVLLAGGIGMTPIRSLVTHIHDAQLPVTIKLIHSARGQYLYRPEIERLVPGALFVDRDTFDQTLRTTIDAADIESSVFYLSGPPPFVAAANATLQELGARHIRSDGFLGYTRTD